MDVGPDVLQFLQKVSGRIKDLNKDNTSYVRGEQWETL